MLIKFKHLELEGFQSFGHAEVSLGDRGFTLINGINNNPVDNALSNGAGKTTIFNALCYCLCGETTQGVSKNLVNINTTTGLKTELEFDVDNNSYRILRTKEHGELGTSLRFWVNGEEKSGKGIRDTEKLISEYLPDLTSDLIGSVIIIGQGMPQRFTGNTPSGRKEVLEKLSKSDFMIEDIKDRLAKRKSALTKEQRDLELEQTNQQGKLTVHQQQLETYQSQLDNLVEPDPEQLQIISSKVEEVKARVASLNEELQTKKEQVFTLTQKQSSILNEQTTESAKIQESYRDKLVDLKSEESQVHAEYTSLKSEISRLKSIVDVCPTCGQKLPNVHKVDTSEKEQLLEELKVKESSFTQKIEELKQAQAAEITELDKKYQLDRVSIVNEINSAKTELNNVNKELELQNREEKHLSSQFMELQLAQKSFSLRKEELQNSIKNTEREIAKLHSEILYSNMCKEKTAGHLDVVNKMLTIATRDFRGFLLTNIIEYINRRAKTYCMDIFDTDKIDLSLDSNNLNVTYNGKMYENLSGGEQRKVDIINQLALRDMLCQFSSFSSNLLVLDETFESLDNLGCQRIIDVITKRLTDIESIFIITHRSNLSLPADSTITIIKDENGISRIA